MSKLILTTLLAGLTLMFTTQVYAASSHSTHESDDNADHQGHDMGNSQGMAADHGSHDSGIKIHTSSLDGYTFEYKLIDMREKMKHLKNMPEMKDTHHLMVFVKDTNGAAVSTAKVGYLIQEKDSGAVQKKMDMGMNKGFGADVTLTPGNHYTIKTKVMAGGRKLIDEFKYMGGDH
ncbi:MAG: hypothetical protein HUK40_05395 [Desulfobacter sp.]|nr:hypothetical protein [Desulfobacter sp.]